MKKRFIISVLETGTGVVLGCVGALLLNVHGPTGPVVTWLVLAVLAVAVAIL